MFIFFGVFLLLVGVFEYLCLRFFKQFLCYIPQYKSRKYLLNVYWASLIILYLSLTIFLIFFGFPCKDHELLRKFFLLVSFFMVNIAAKTPMFVLHFMIMPFKNRYHSDKSFFCYKVFQFLGISLSLWVFLLFADAMIFGKHRIVVKHQKIRFETLPPSFEGFRIVHISDLHLGSFAKKNTVKKVVDIIQTLHPDLIVFTGDLVNFVAGEAISWVGLLQTIKAKEGKYAVLGNHDFGHYALCYDENEIEKNTNTLISLLKAMDFTVLADSACILKSGKDSIALIGVHNWNSGRLMSIGNLKKAMQGTENIDFRILLTHDPIHWRKEVEPLTDIQLTLSGHTHGMQMGFGLFNWKWSAYKLVSRYDRGLFSKGDQYLYINQGIGNNGFLGRVGIGAEISVIELQGAKCTEAF
jgi:uncharacterized protein